MDGNKTLRAGGRERSLAGARPIGAGVAGITRTVPIDVLDDDSSGVTSSPDLARWQENVGGRLLVVAIVLWIGSLFQTDLRAMTDLGLLSVAPTSFYAALAVGTLGFFWVLVKRPHRWPVLGGYITLLSATVHATPALLYGTVRYSWSWKHVGIVDFIQRTGEVDPESRFHQIYHGWPGLFTATALFSDITGIAPQTVATWAPFVLNMLSLLALSLLFRVFTDNRRLVWLSLWLWIVANWVGQEYFSPQGFTFMLYLTLLAVAIPLDRRRDAITGRFHIRAGVGPSPIDPTRRRVVTLFLLATAFVIVSSHQLTPIMIMASLGLVAAVRASRTLWLAIATMAMTLGWFAGPAWPYLRENAIKISDTLGSPTETSSGSVIDTADISAGQVAIVIADRFLVLAMVALAVCGAWLAWRRGQSMRVILVLMGAPGVLLVMAYGGEILFRSYLFATPWIAFCAGIAMLALTAGRTSSFRLVAMTVTSTAILIAFLLAYLGKENTNYFTPDEVELTEWLYDSAPGNTLLIEGSRNYPGSATNYEKFFFVALGHEKPSNISRINNDPEGVLFTWLDNDAYNASYVVITRSMKNEQNSVPTMPVGLLERIETALRASDRFEVIRSNQDGVVFTLAGVSQ